jgi:hypothetical protein
MGKRNGNPRALVSKAPPRFLKRSAPSELGSTLTAARRFTYRLLLYLTQRHPFLFWTGSWLLMVLIAWTSINGLLHTDVEPLEAEAPQPEVVARSPEQVPLVSQPSAPASSFGMLVAVVLSCGATSMVLARQLRSAKPASAKPSPQRRAVKSVLPSQRKSDLPLPSVHASSPSRSRPQARVARTPVGVVPQTSKPQVSSRPQGSKPQVSYQKAKPSAPLPNQPIKQPVPKHAIVSVVPPDENHPLDWGDRGLADRLDIRKHKSISSYL